MAPKRRKGGKKRKKGKKKTKIDIHPPPLHTLTDLYNQLKEKVRHLEEMRVMSRKKRLEGWFMAREMSSLKSDNQIYHDYLDDNINELHEIIVHIMESIEKERVSIQKEIDRLLAELNKRHAKINQRIQEVQQQLAQAKLDLSAFEPLMAKLAKMLARLEQLAKDIAAAELEADIKTRHLKNQFLFERAKLHNHLEKQLYDLIQNCRKYIMPILWHHMRRTQFQNNCARWKLAKADAKNIRLGELRDDLMLKRKLLTLETNYLGVDWAILKLSEIQTEHRLQGKESRKIKKPSPEKPPTELALAFNIYLKKRLTAFHEAKKRSAKAKQFALENIASSTQLTLSDAGTEHVDNDEDLEEEDQWVDLDEEEIGGEDWESPVKYPKRKRRRKPKYFSADGESDEESDYEEHEYNSDSSSYSSDSNGEHEYDEHSNPAHNWSNVVTRISKGSVASTSSKSQGRETLKRGSR